MITQGPRIVSLIKQHLDDRQAPGYNRNNSQSSSLKQKFVEVLITVGDINSVTGLFAHGQFAIGQFAIGQFAQIRSPKVRLGYGSLG